MAEVPVMITDNSSALTVLTQERDPYDAERAAFVAGWIRGFAVGEALAAQEPYEPQIVEPAVKSES
jgi:hypothetical protein